MGSWEIGGFNWENVGNIGQFLWLQELENVGNIVQAFYIATSFVLQDFCTFQAFIKTKVYPVLLYHIRTKKSDISVSSGKAFTNEADSFLEILRLGGDDHEKDRDSNARLIGTACI